MHKLAKRIAIFGGFGVLLFGVLGFALFNGTDVANLSSANPANREQVALGQRVYMASCASCHGANLEGQRNWQQELPTGGYPAPPHDVTGHTWHHNDQALFDIVKYGGQPFALPGYKNNMPAFGSALSDGEIWAVLAYIKSTWPPEIQEAQKRGHQ